MLRAMAGTNEIFVFKDALIVLGTAAVVAPVVHRLKISPILGFLVVGAAIGPHGLGRLAEHSRAIDWLTVTGERQIGFIADFGIVFLLFSLGLEFSLPQLRAMQRGAVVQTRRNASWAISSPIAWSPVRAVAQRAASCQARR